MLDSAVPGCEMPEYAGTFVESRTMSSLGQKLFNRHMTVILVGSMCVGGAAIADRIRRPEPPESSTPHPKESRIPGKSSHLGFAGRIDLFAIEIDGKLFLQARGDSHQGAIAPLRALPGAELKFNATSVSLTLPDTAISGDGGRKSDKFF